MLKDVSFVKNVSVDNRKKLFFHNEDRRFLYDYCHKSYIPDKPVIGKLKSENLLFESFRFESCGDEFYKFVEALKKGFGSDNTVWGVKKIDDCLSWEFYFNNYDKKDPRISITNFFAISKEFFSTKLDVNEKAPYFMFSVDISRNEFRQKKIKGVHIYLPLLLQRGGYCYFQDIEKTCFENLYHFFYEPNDKMRQVIAEIKNALFNDFRGNILNNVLIPELLKCNHICVAHKKDRESIYYSGITIDQFLFFLTKFEYPYEIIAFLKEKKGDLDHLLYDVGFDYQINNNVIKVIKSGYYGTT